MVDYNIPSLLSEIESNPPCGDDISYDPDFLAIENTFQPSGGGILGQEETLEIDWNNVAKQSVSLLSRSKNLRVTVFFVNALLRLHGFKGLCDGLQLIQGLLEQYWDNLYPQLDPEDAFDPIERINIFMSFSPETAGGPSPLNLPQTISTTPLCDSRQLGRYSYRDIQVAKGFITPVSESEKEALNLSIIEAAFQDSDKAELTQTSQYILDSIERLGGIMDVFTQRAANRMSPNLEGLQKLLQNTHKCINDFVQVSSGQDAASAEVSASSPQPGGSISAAVPGQINTPQDAAKLLERLCEYFEKNEPSSPVPLLLKRAQKLISMSFYEIVEEMCPDAIGEINRISGMRRNE